MPCQPTGMGGPGGQGSGLDASGLYTSVISIARYPDAATGNIGHRGMQQSIETTFLTGLPATIDFAYRGPDPVAHVPSDIVGRSLWRIYIPANRVTLGAIRRDDVATDDLGRRYKLNEPLWGAIDVQIEAELLRA